MILKGNRLILVDATLDNRSLEFARAIHSDGDFEWYFGLEETPERLVMLEINKKGYYNILDIAGNFVGYIGVHYKDPEPRIELYIKREYRRKGYAKKALSVILTKAFCEGINGVKIQKFVSLIRKENVASQKLMESCGFKRKKEKGCRMLAFFDKESNSFMENTIEIVHYYITREMFEKRSSI